MNHNGLKILLLILLSNKKYDSTTIIQTIADNHYWKATHQQIYKYLNDMSDEGYLSFDVNGLENKDAKGKDRKVYFITDFGKKTLINFKLLQKDQGINSMLAVAFLKGDKSYLLSRVDEQKILLNSLEMKLSRTTDKLAKILISEDVDSLKIKINTTETVLNLLLENTF